MREIASERYKDLTSPSLMTRRLEMVTAHSRIASLDRQVEAAKAAEEAVQRRMSYYQNRRFRRQSETPDLEREWRDHLLERYELEEKRDEAAARAYLQYGEDEARWHRIVSPAFDLLAAVDKIWDATHRAEDASGARVTYSKEPCRLYRGELPTICPGVEAFSFENANGPDLHILPGVIVVGAKNLVSSFALISFTDCRFSLREVQFREEGALPSDARVVSVERDQPVSSGRSNRRLKSSRKIPICLYGGLSITSKTGLQEEYMFSDYNATLFFTQALVLAQDAEPDAEAVVSFHGMLGEYASRERVPVFERQGMLDSVSAPDRDDLFLDAAFAVVRNRQVSPVLLERKLSINHARALRIMDQLEEAGIIGTIEGFAERRLLVSSEEALWHYV